MAQVSGSLADAVVDLQTAVEELQYRVRVCRFQVWSLTVGLIVAGLGALWQAFR